MCPPFDFGNRTVIKDGKVLMQGTIPNPGSLVRPSLGAFIAPASTADSPLAITLDDSVLVALLSGAIRNHNLACQFMEANVYWHMLQQISDPVRNYRVYQFQVCTHCATIHRHSSTTLSICRCDSCTYESVLIKFPVLATESNLCDSLEFAIAKLSQPYHDLLMEYLSNASQSNNCQL